MDPQFPIPMICSTLSVTLSILAPGKQTTTSYLLLNLESVFITFITKESPYMPHIAELHSIELS